MEFVPSKGILLLAILAVISPNVARGQTLADDELMHWEAGINGARIAHLRALAPDMMPDCKIQASASEILDFFSFWRRDAAYRVSMLEKADRPDYTSPRLMGPVQIAGSVPLRDLEKVDENTPGALDAAKSQIEIWHLYRCVDADFHSQKYFGAYGYDGVIRPGNIQETFARVPNTQTAMLLPNMAAVEPVGALGNFFHAADAKQLLAFNDADERRYFFDRYDTDYFVNLPESAVTQRWFQSPPWSARP